MYHKDYLYMYNVQNYCVLYNGTIRACYTRRLVLYSHVEITWTFSMPQFSWEKLYLFYFGLLLRSINVKIIPLLWYLSIDKITKKIDVASTFQHKV